MLKTISICVALIVLGTSVAAAQQREAFLKKLEVPGADFDIVVAMAKPGGAIVDQGGLPDPLVVSLAGTELAIGLDGEAVMMIKDIGLLLTPACAANAGRKNGSSSKSIAVYVVPKGEPAALAVR
jgi:hypothetical protein